MRQPCRNDGELMVVCRLSLHSLTFLACLGCQYTKDESGRAGSSLDNKFLKLEEKIEKNNLVLETGRVDHSSAQRFIVLLMTERHIA